LLALAAILCLSTCENPYVQELLRDAAALDGLHVSAGEVGNNYEVSPSFSPSVTEYSVRVPFLTETVSLTAVPHTGGSAVFLKADGSVFDGRYPFTEDDSARVFIRAERPYMDTRIYSLTIIRGPDSWLRKIQVWSGNGAVDTSETLPLVPGFDPDKHDDAPLPGGTVYTVTVPNASDRLRVTGTVKTGVVIEYSTDGGTNYGAWTDMTLTPTDEPEIKIKVHLTGSPEQPLKYTLRVKRPKEVIADNSGGSVPDIIISGAPLNGTYYFSDGYTVSFQATANFGYTITNIKLENTNDGSLIKKITGEDLNAAGLYSFIMGNVPVTITGTSQTVSAVTGVKYVRGGGTEDGDGGGSSWANASGNLQKIIDNLNPASEEIWIAGGTLTPDWSDRSGTNSLWPDGVTDRKQWAFVLKTGVRIYGGFTGTEDGAEGTTDAEKRAAAKASRDRRANPTVLSGDLGENGSSRHVVIAAGLDADAPPPPSPPPLLEGLTISGGRALISGSAMTVNGQTIETTETTSGGGLYCVKASPILCNVIIEGNNALQGGGINAKNASPILINVSITGNSVNTKGSGIYLNGGMPLIINGYISGNAGSSVIQPNDSGGAVTLVNTTIINNSSGLEMTYSGGTNTANYIFNSVIRDNGSSNVSVDGGGTVSLVNSLVPGHVNTLTPVNTNYTDRGDIAYYPLALPLAGLTLNTTSGDFDTQVLAKLIGISPAGLNDEILEYLTTDRNGNSRINGGVIDLGAVEQ
jgi:hypothetical protein